MSDPSNNLSIGNAHYHLPYDRIDEYLPFMRDRNLNIEIYFGSNNYDSLKIDDIKDLKKRLDYNPSISVHGPFLDLSPAAIDQSVREATLQRFHNVLDYAEILAPKVIVFHSGYDKWKYDRHVDIWLEKSLMTWREIDRRASDMGVKIAIENIFEDEPDHLKLLSEEMNSDNFGLCFDTGHFNMFSKLPLTEWLGKIKPYITELHIHDNHRYADEHLAIGDGDFDFKTLFEELRDIDCLYTIEAHKLEDMEKSLERIKEYSNKVF